MKSQFLKQLRVFAVTAVGGELMNYRDPEIYPYFKRIEYDVNTIAFRCYKDVYGAYGYYPNANAVENTYCICSLMDSIITDIYHESNGYTEEEIIGFAEFLKDELGLKLEDYVSDFIGCSHGVAGVSKKLYEILYEDEPVK